MQFSRRPLVVLVALASLISSQVIVGSPANDDEDLQTQIESPPKDDQDVEGIAEREPDEDTDGDGVWEGEDAEGKEPDEDTDGDGVWEGEDTEGNETEPAAAGGGYDVDYKVNRPPEEQTKVRVCGIEDLNDPECIQAGKVDLKPYEKYPGYESWERRPLFVIIIGGLRWDYLRPSPWNMTEKVAGRLDAFQWIREHGTTLKQVSPVFPSYDLPTWTSLATGLYPQATGVTGDYMYDLKSKQLFSRGDSLDGWWVKGEPIWSIAAKENRKVSVVNWHDCNLPGFKIENQVDCKPYQVNSGIPGKQQLNKLFNQAFSKIHSSDYDLSIVYTDAVKKAAIRYGANSKEVMETLADVDDVLQNRLSDIKNKKERANLKLNILLLSDYGLNTREETTKLVLDDYIDFHHVQYIIQRGGSTVLVPYALKTGGILDGVGELAGVGNMVGVDTYVRNVNLEVPPLEYPTIPPELKYSGFTWTQDILLLAKPGYEIEIRNLNSSKLLPPWDGDQAKAVSGYHPSPPAPHIQPGRDKHKSPNLRAREKVELDLHHRFASMMKTIGFAWGPDFKAGYVSEDLEQVDIYQLFAFLLQVQPNPHQGDWDRVKGMLKLNDGVQCQATLVTTIITLLTTLYVLQ